MNDEPNLEQEIEQTIDDVDFSTMQNDDACINMCQRNMNKTNNDQGLNTGVSNQLETNIGNENGAMDSDYDILYNPLLSSSVENYATSSSYQENSSNESKKSL